ncbi:MAG TPA: type II toxin-antitoxin system VapC family toxin [Candidatus Wunengus sp. YC61]|uniref:type II toxin-antitoxin system VapC family toxin n=1 Tax=Candidatus Wunengus sp. YC61 TaxID=3367698 RepID=UPI0040263E17
MRLFLDTDVFLEILLEQEKALEAKAVLSRAEDHEFFISDFSLHSIGLLLFYRKQHNIFQHFLKDMILTADVTITSLGVDDMESIVAVAQKFSLDFDDAYQYVATQKQGLTIVSFDADFDRTEQGRKTPADILKISD